MNLHRAYSSVSEHSIFLSVDGELYIQGLNREGSLGPGPVLRTYQITLPGELSCVASGTHHTLALITDGRVFVWGSNSSNQLGLDCTSTDTPTLLPLSTREKVVQVKAGAYFSIAITSTGALYVFGRDAHIGGTDNKNPTPTVLPSPVVHVACGWASIFAITQDGSLYVWGDNNHGCLGLGDADPRAKPTLHPLKDIIAVAAASTTGFFLTKTGKLLAAGYHQYGTVGCSEKVVEVLTPTVVLEGVVDVAGGGQHGMALMEDGGVMTWGWNLFGQLGSEEEKVPRRIPVTGTGGETKKFVGIGAGWGFSFMVAEDHEIYLWGASGRGGQDIQYRVPTVYRTCKGVFPKNFMLDWPQIFSWIFLGQADAGSLFSTIPIEVVYQCVKVLA
jgi:alpha-tubulin suppressor-like RCC1 family protein